jgi:ABC-type phosphate transport system substrate-binding protein
LDAVAVIVHPQNTLAQDVTIENLYDIYSGKINRFSQLLKGE